MKDLLQIISTRRSVRAFHQDPIPDSLIDTLLSAAISAPSAGNVQPWFFYIVKNPRIKKLLVESALKQTFIAKAPVVLIVCADLARAQSSYGQRGVSLYCIQDTAAAIQNLLIAAHASGLGACWIGAFSETDVANILNMPSSHRPIALVPLGNPNQKAHYPGRREIREVSSVVE